MTNHIARGLQRANGTLRRVVVSFDDETFAEIRARAVTRETSFAQQVRELVEWGLMDKKALAAGHFNLPRRFAKSVAL